MRFHPAPPIIAREPAQLSAVFFLLISPAASFTPTLSLSLSLSPLDDGSIESNCPRRVAEKDSRFGSYRHLEKKKKKNFAA